MTYVHSFEIAGLAGQAGKISRVLDRHVNVFWGLNGTGKTTLLRILHSALQNDASLITNLPFETATVRFWSNDSQVFVRRSIEKQSFSPRVVEDWVDREGIRWATRVEASRAGELRWESKLDGFDDDEFFWEEEEEDRKSKLTKALQIQYQHTYLPISRLSQASGGRAINSYGRRVVVDDDFLDEQFADQVRSRWQTYNARALDEIREIQQQGLAAILSILFAGEASVESSFLRDSLVSNEVSASDAYQLVRSFLVSQKIPLRISRNTFVHRYKSDRALQEVVSSIRATTQSVERELRPQVEFRGLISRLFSGNKEIDTFGSSAAGRTLQVNFGIERIPLESLSSGEKQLLRICLEVLAAESNSVMVDEPELSMHVDWQLILVDSLLRINPDCQLILATHSPEVMADIDERYVFQL